MINNQITGICKINEKPVNFLLDTGSNRTIVNINAIDVNNNVNGKLYKLNQNVLTANGQLVLIIGVKRCKLQINNFSCVMEILVVQNLVKECIIGMDFIMQCPSTNKIVTKLRDFVEDNINTESDLNKSNKFNQTDA